VVVTKMERPELAAAFERGELDLLVPNSLNPDQSAALAKKRPDAVTIEPSNMLVSLLPDLAHPQLRRFEVRKALLQAIDRAAIALDEYGPAGRIAHAPVPRLLDDRPLPEVRYDPAAAKKVLEP